GPRAPHPPARDPTAGELGDDRLAPVEVTVELACDDGAVGEAKREASGVDLVLGDDESERAVAELVVAAPVLVDDVEASVRRDAEVLEADLRRVHERHRLDR